jgi:hypothetical protein
MSDARTNSNTMFNKILKVQDIKFKNSLSLSGPTCFDGSLSSSGTYDIIEKEGDQWDECQF